MVGTLMCDNFISVVKLASLRVKAIQQYHEKSGDMSLRDIRGLMIHHFCVIP